MKPIKWDESLDVGIEDLNEEHKVLMHGMNEFINAIENKDLGNMYRIIGKYKKLYEDHIKHEEEILMNNGYPNLEEHKAAHRDVIVKISSIATLQLKKDDLLNALELFKGEFVNHIKNYDLKYKEFLEEKLSKI